MSDIFLQLHGVPQQQQRQDSTHDQLKDLVVIANRFGLYDAADHLQEEVTRTERLIGLRVN